MQKGYKSYPNDYIDLDKGAEISIQPFTNNSLQTGVKTTRLEFKAFYHECYRAKYQHKDNDSNGKDFLLNIVQNSTKIINVAYAIVWG